MRKLGRHHLIEAEDALGVVAQGLRTGDDRDLSLPGADEPADQGAGGATGGDIVDADIMVTPRSGHVRHQRHDLGAAIDEIVDGGADAWMIKRDDRHAVEVAGKRFKRGSENSRIEHVGRDQLNAETAGREPRRHLAEIRVDLLHEQIRAGRHHEGEAPRPAASQLGRSHMRLKGVPLDRRLDATDGVRSYAGTIVENPVHRREAHSGLARNVPERERCTGVLPSHGAKHS